MNDYETKSDETNSAEFPHAPQNWSPEDATAMASQDGIELNDDHWQVLKSLQDYFSKQENVGANIRELYDALDEKFHAQGGMKYLYKLFPGGPVAQGGRLAGLDVPDGARDLSFGSVQ